MHENITAEQIVELMPIVGKEWVIIRTSNDGRESLIRTNDGECPACAVFNAISGSILSREWPISAKYWSPLGLNREDHLSVHAWDSAIQRVISAADCPLGPELGLRRRMLEIAGLRF